MYEALIFLRRLGFQMIGLWDSVAPAYLPQSMIMQKVKVALKILFWFHKLFIGACILMFLEQDDLQIPKVL